VLPQQGEANELGSLLQTAAARVANGDGASFAEVVARTSAPLYRLAARLMGNTADAEDAVQDAYLRAFTALRAGRFDGRAELRTWLYRIVTNACLDGLRRRRSRPVPAGDWPEGSFDGRVTAEARLALRELDRWLGHLPPEQRATLVLRFVEGLSSAEVATIMDCSEGAVEQRLVRARASLRQKSRGDDDDEA
jgi:RNA polymerase sigma-70 factor (ECF subfamily)